MVQLEVLVSLIAGCAVLATCLTTCLISVDLATPLTLTVASQRASNATRLRCACSPVHVCMHLHGWLVLVPVKLLSAHFST